MKSIILSFSESDAFSLDTFKGRFLLLSPADVTYDICYGRNDSEGTRTMTQKYKKIVNVVFI